MCPMFKCLAVTFHEFDKIGLAVAGQTRMDDHVMGACDSIYTVHLHEFELVKYMRQVAGVLAQPMFVQKQAARQRVGQDR